MSGRTDRLHALDAEIARERASRDAAWYAVGHDWAYSLDHEMVIDVLLAERAAITATP